MELGRGIHDPTPVYDTHLGVDVLRCSWGAHMNEVVRKGKAQMGKMNVIVVDSHLHTRTTVYSYECDGTEARTCRKSMGCERRVGEVAGHGTDASS